MEPLIWIEQSDPSERMVQLNSTTLNIIFEASQLEETITLTLGKLSLQQLYTLQKKTQKELQNKEELVHKELLLVNKEWDCYAVQCATLRKKTDAA